MKQILSLFFVLLGINLFSAYVSADIDVFEFSSEQQRQQYLSLTKELRCPKCQNQDIADSNAPIAQDMRREVHRMVEQGETHGTIVNFMIDRFGDFVTYKPKVAPSTYLLWYGPWILGILGLVVVYVLASKKRAKIESSTTEGLTSTQEKQLQQLLERYDEEASSRTLMADESDVVGSFSTKNSSQKPQTNKQSTSTNETREPGRDD